MGYRSTVWRISAFLTALAVGLAWHASLPGPIGPAHGVELEGEVTRKSQARPTPTDANPLAEHNGRARAFRIGTFNIHGGKGLDGRRNVGRVADCLADLDFVALNEVRGGRPWEAFDQAAQIGRRQGLAWLFAPSGRTWHCLDSGNGLVSALPVTFWQRIPLQRRSGRGYRNAVIVGLKHRDRTIHVLLTHLARSDAPEREEQLRAVVSLYLSLAEPAILLGDLNSTADDPLVRRLLDSPRVRDPVGERLGPQDLRRIDWIITRGLKCVDAGIRQNDASDHPLVWAELE